MPRALYRTILLMVGVIAYAWLCRELYLFIEMDDCIDHGGIIDPVTLACDGARHGEAHFFGRNTPLVAWVFLFALPVVPGLIAAAIARAVLYPWRPAPSNSALDSDTYSAPLRAPSSARQRGR